MSDSRAARTILASMILLSFASASSAQWVFVAKKALGRIERMSQPATNGIPGYDVATVVIKGRADNVYAAALNAINARPKLTIVRQDPRERTIDFNDGTHAVGLRVSQVNDQVVHLLVVTSVSTAQDNTESLAVSGVMRVCKELGATCKVAK